MPWSAMIWEGWRTTSIPWKELHHTWLHLTSTTRATTCNFTSSWATCKRWLTTIRFSSSRLLSFRSYRGSYSKSLPVSGSIELFLYKRLFYQEITKSNNQRPKCLCLRSHWFHSPKVTSLWKTPPTWLFTVSERARLCASGFNRERRRLCCLSNLRRSLAAAPEEEMNAKRSKILETMATSSSLRSDQCILIQRGQG